MATITGSATPTAIAKEPEEGSRASSLVHKLSLPSCMRCLICFLLPPPSKQHPSSSTMAPLTRSRKQQLEQEQQPSSPVIDPDNDRSKPKRQRVKDPAGGECGRCKEPTGSNGIVASCSHRFCRRCVEENFSKFMKRKDQDANPALEMESALSAFQCPESRCTEEFRRFDLIELLGIKRMRLHENWLIFAFRQLYTPVLYSDHPQKMVCCDKKWSSAKLSLNMKCLPKQEAVGTRGLQSKFMKGDVCNPSLFSYTGWSKKGQSKAQWACSRCGRTWCALCGRVVSWIRGKTDHYTTCTGQQTFKLYESMMQLEAACSSYSATDEATPEQGRKASAGRKAAKTIWANGTGFGGDAKYGSAKGGLADTQKEAKQKEQSTDEVVTRNLSYLTSVLREEMEGDDSSLFTSTCAILGMGNILNRLLRQLVANDSMLDISERRLVYTSMVELLKEFASLEHRDLDCILLGCDHSVDEACTLGKDLSVIKKMENIYKQAKVMVQRVTSVDAGAQVDDINLAKEFCACYESLEAKIIKESHGPTEAPAVRRMTRSEEAEEEADEERIKQRMKEYKERLRTLQFKEVVMADENGQYKHYHNYLINGVKPQSGTIDKRGVHNQKRMLHMAKEISSLSTTLPLEWESSIHLYVDQNRLDVLRALIIGPSDTPYQNGIFQFDIFLPADYPQVPPHVHFLTTGSNRVRFNPNLYENGKICLSLLGTWSGPGWIPGRSTLLQVLVSIQSLIFVKEPYYNEPGFEQKASPEAERESQRHRENTLSLAILAPLQKQDPFFSELIFEHFLLKKEEVEQQCTEWLALATDSAMQQRMNQSVQSIKAQLATL